MIEAGTTLVTRYTLTARRTSDLVAAPAWAAADGVLDREVRVTLPEGPRVPAVLDAARRAALVADPRLARVLDVGIDRVPTPDGAVDVAYVVTEPYGGVSLDELVAGGPLDAAHARAIVGEAAAALESARRRGLHHEALRPGAVRVVGSKVLVTGLGTDAPSAGVDDADGDRASRADASGLVALLYFLLTARWPLADLDTARLVPGAPRPSAAPRTADGPAPVTDLAPQVPADLAALCAATLATQPTGPATPGEVVAALEPWGPVETPRPVERTSVLRSSNGVPGTDAGTHDDRPAGAVPATPVPTTPVPPAPAPVPPSAGAWPPPASPARPSVDPASVPLPALAAAYRPAAPQPPVASPVTTTVPPDRAAAWAAQAAQVRPAPWETGASPAAPAADRPRDTLWPDGKMPRSAAELDRHTFNPTRYVLIFFLLAVALVTALAVGGLTHNFRPAFVYAGDEPTFGGSTPGPTTQGQQPGPPPAAPVQEVRPVIAKGEQIDPPPQGDENEHPEAVDRALDGDLDTYWYTRTYRTQQFSGLKSGVGYAITLKQAATVSTIILDTNDTGGHVEVRATDASDPTSGTVLASGPLSAETTLTLSRPTKAKTFVLWFTELPVTSEGKFRVELNEIQVS